MENQTEQPKRFQGEHTMGGKEALQTKAEATDKAMVVSTVKATSSGMLVGSTLDEQWRLAKAYCSSNMLPKGYDKPEKVLTAMQFAYELGLKPLTGMRQIAVINGTPSLFGDLPLSLVQGSGKCEWVKEFFIDQNGEVISWENKNLTAKPWGAVCISKRKGAPEAVTSSFTLDEARSAGLLGKAGPWTQYQKRMLQMRARSTNLKDNFADVLSGASIAEYDYNVSEHSLAGGTPIAATHQGDVKPAEPIASLFDGVDPVEPEPFEIPKAIEAEVVQAEAPKPKKPKAKKDEPVQDAVVIDPKTLDGAELTEAMAKMDAILPAEDPDVISFGRLTGLRPDEVKKEELTTVFFQLQGQLKTWSDGDVPPELTKTVALIKAHLGFKG